MPALDGGDPWAGVRADEECIASIADEACSTTVQEPIIPQWFPRRRWLWNSTRFRPKAAGGGRPLQEVAWNMGIAMVIALVRIRGARLANTGSWWKYATTTRVPLLARRC